MFSHDCVIYEQPANEAIRVCLRLEYLFNKVQHWLEGDKTWDSDAALITMLEILTVLDRPDFKSKLIKEISHHSSLFKSYQALDHVDQSKLAAISCELEKNIGDLNAMRDRIGQSLYNDKFVHIAYQSLLNPGMGGGFDVAVYHAWLHQPIDVRKQQLQLWLDNFTVIQKAVRLILYLIRHSSVPKRQIAHKGVYQANGFSGKSICQLVQVAVDLNAGVYPQISVGRHGFAVQFLKFDIQGSLPVSDDVSFRLTYCFV